MWTNLIRLFLDHMVGYRFALHLINRFQGPIPDVPLGHVSSCVALSRDSRIEKVPRIRTPHTAVRWEINVRGGGDSNSIYVDCSAWTCTTWGRERRRRRRGMEAPLRLLASGDVDRGREWGGEEAELGKELTLIASDGWSSWPAGGFARHRRHPAPREVAPTGPCACRSCAPDGSFPSLLVDLWLWDWKRMVVAWWKTLLFPNMRSSSTLICVPFPFFFLFSFKAALKWQI